MLNKKIYRVGGHHSMGISGTADPDRRDQIIEEVKALVAAGKKHRDHPDWNEYFTLTVEEWKLSDWVIAKAYHWYDMRIPGGLWYKIEKHLPGSIDVALGFAPGPATRWDRLKAWSLNQDFRCFSLSEKHETIATFPTDEATYRTVYPEPTTRRTVGDTVGRSPTKEALWAAMQAVSRRMLRKLK